MKKDTVSTAVHNTESYMSKINNMNFIVRFKILGAVVLTWLCFNERTSIKIDHK